MSRHRELVDGFERMDRQSVGDFGERASLSSGHVDLRGLQEEDFEDDYAKEFFKDPLVKADPGTSDALLDAEQHMHSIDEGSERQSNISKAFYKLFGLKWYNKVFNRNMPLGPQMYRFHNVGLYAHYAVSFLFHTLAHVCLCLSPPPILALIIRSTPLCICLLYSSFRALDCQVASHLCASTFASIFTREATMFVAMRLPLFSSRGASRLSTPS